MDFGLAIIFLTALIFFIYFFFTNPARRTPLLRILATTAALVLLGYIGVVALFLLLFSGIKEVYLSVTIILWLELLCVVLLLIWRREKLKTLGKPLLAVFLLCAISSGGYYFWEVQQDKIPVLRDRNLDLSRYEPFAQGSKLARLGNPAHFKIKGDPPRLDGALALYPIMAAFVEATYPPGDYKYPENNDKSPVRMRNTPGAYQALIDGETDIIFCAAPSKEQIATAQKAGVELKLTPIGKEAFVFFVNSQNPVQGLTVEQIQDIYTGKITNWQAVGGKNDRIKAFQRNAGSGSQSALERLMAGKKLIDPPTEERSGSMGGIVNMTADYKNHTNALGFSFRYFTTEMFTSKEIRLLAINGVLPDKETIRNGSYPLTAEIYAITAGSKNPQVQPVIDWILSEEGQKLIEDTGYVRIK